MTKTRKRLILIVAAGLWLSSSAGADAGMFNTLGRWLGLGWSDGFHSQYRVWEDDFRWYGHVDGQIVPPPEPVPAPQPHS